MNPKPDATLIALAEMLILAVTHSGAIREGIVSTIGPTPYRRLDCDGRALAYVRTRPKLGAVRIDVPGLWATPKTSRLNAPTSAGSALFVRSEDDLPEAVRFMNETVERTQRIFGGPK